MASWIEKGVGDGKRVRSVKVGKGMDVEKILDLLYHGVNADVGKSLLLFWRRIREGNEGCCEAESIAWPLAQTVAC